VLWQGNKGTRSTCRVGSFPEGKSAFGLLDMAGNVWEWTARGFSLSYDQPRSSDQRVLRGGGWGDADPNYVSVVVRGSEPPGIKSAMFGFRCARSALSAHGGHGRGGP
jgi:formylglycine-generating enzyme required for sulfatase activity